MNSPTTNATPYYAALIACRILALYCLYHTVPLIGAALFLLDHYDTVGRESTVAIMAMNVAFFIAVWFGAHPLARAIVKIKPGDIPPETSHDRRWLSLIVAAVGLAVLALSIPTAAYYAAKIAQGKLIYQEPGFFEAGVKILLGFGLLIGREKIVHLIDRARTAAT